MSIAIHPQDYDTLYELLERGAHYDSEYGNDEATEAMIDLARSIAIAVGRDPAGVTPYGHHHRYCDEHDWTRWQHGGVCVKRRRCRKCGSSEYVPREAPDTVVFYGI